MQTILVAYNEIALKGRYVRSQLEKKLAQDISNILRRKGYSEYKVRRRFGRIYVDNITAEAAPVISKVFGVASVMPSAKTDSEKLNVLDLLVKVSSDTMGEGESFAVRPKVVGEHEYSRRDLAVEGGSAVMIALKERDISVNLTKPDHTFYIEVRDKDAYVYTQIVKGVGGLPYGSQGKLVSLFSGGIDSPVATWLIMKRGAEVLPLLMDQRPYVGDSYIERAKQAALVLREYSPKSQYRMYLAPMGKIMEQITKAPEQRYNCVLCKRSMYRIASMFSLKHKAKGVVTGESLGQVASQTLDNLYVLDEAVDIPLLRTTIGLDKIEIENMARKIGTYSVTAKSVDGCTVVPGNPTTRAKLDAIIQLEEELGLIDLCKEAFENISWIDLS